MKNRFSVTGWAPFFDELVGTLPNKHNPLLINNLAEFNFRPPLLLVFPGEQADKNRRSRP